MPILCLFAASQSLAGTAEAEASLHRLKQLIGDRLLVMPDVAAYKWSHDRPIEDLEREAQILSGLATKAEQYGIPADQAAAFFQAQFAAAKEIQQQLFDDWQAEGRGPFDAPPDLVSDLRPRLSALTDPILQELAATAPYWGSDQARRILTSPDPRWAEQPDVWSIAIGPITQ